MNGIKLFAALFLIVALCGCSRTGLGDKVMVKALFVDYEQEYTAQVLVLEPQPSADAGEAAETLRLIEGQGETLSQAIRRAENSSAEELFYGQNELLLIGPGLQRDGVFACCRFLYENSAGRPNMAVWGINAPASEQPLTEENADVVLARIRRLGERGAYHTYLYQLAAAQGSGILPLVRLSGQDNVQVQALAVYREEQSVFRFLGSEMELAALFSGQSGTGQLEVETEIGPVTLMVRSQKLIYECSEEESEMRLAIHFTGHVEQMVGEQVPSAREERRALLTQINDRLEQTANEVIHLTFQPGGDPFGFLNRFFNQNERKTKSLMENNAIYDEGSVAFSSELWLL